MEKTPSYYRIVCSKNEHHVPVVGAILQFKHTLQLLSSSFIDERYFCRTDLFAGILLFHPFIHAGSEKKKCAEEREIS